MNKDTLYLHVGWSKTGTSAIQAQIQLQQADFLKQGILYSQTLQWPDHSHHPFALAFRSIGAYQGDMTPTQALERLTGEMNASPAENILLSSELSPFYSDNPVFTQFVAEHFRRVCVLFTVRVQSELILSLFNQLIKDPNVRYGFSLFTLAIRNMPWLNYQQNIMRWCNLVGQENITVIPYGKDVVDRFLQHFGVALPPEGNGAAQLINPSMPTRCLLLLQHRGRTAKNKGEYVQIRNEIVQRANTIPTEHDRNLLFSVPEQQAYDDHFKHINRTIAEKFQFDLGMITKTDYKPIKALPPGFPLEKFQEIVQ